jgi:hypothetical protein
LYRDADKPTHGRYFFVPDDHPFVDGPHWLGSRNWWDRNNGLIQPRLGELLSTRQRWDTGAIPVDVPFPIQVGDSDCLARGDSIVHALPLAGQIDGFPSLCFGLATGLNRDFNVMASVWRCCTQSFWANRLLETYVGDIGRCQAILQVRFAGATITFREGTRLFPPYWTIVHPAYACALLSATATMRQALIEVIQGIRGPTDVGAYSTARLWLNYANFVIADLSLQGVNDTIPMLFVGHSYGGAASMLACAQIKIGRPRRYIRYLSFGAPKPGDRRLHEILKRDVRGLSLVNSGDLIGAIPPDAITLASVSPILAVPGLLNWTRWEYPPETALQHDGQLDKNTYQPLATRDVVDLIRHVWLTGSFFGMPRHTMTAYLEEIMKRCPQCPDYAVGDLGLAGLQPAPGRLALTAFDWPFGDLIFGAMSTPRGYLKWAGLQPAPGRLKWAGLQPAPGRVELAGVQPGYGAIELAGVQPAHGSIELTALKAAYGSIELAGVQPAHGSIELAGVQPAHGHIGLGVSSPEMGFVGIESLQFSFVGLPIGVAMPADAELALRGYLSSAGRVALRAFDVSPGPVAMGLPVPAIGAIGIGIVVPALAGLEWSALTVAVASLAFAGFIYSDGDLAFTAVDLHFVNQGALAIGFPLQMSAGGSLALVGPEASTPATGSLAIGKTGPPFWAWGSCEPTHDQVYFDNVVDWGVPAGTSVQGPGILPGTVVVIQFADTAFISTTPTMAVHGLYWFGL